MSYEKIENKVALITGGSEGIGFGIAKAFAEAGAKVAITGRDTNKLKTAKEKLGGKIQTINADITQVELCTPTLDTVLREFGRLDILINNAGAGIYKPISQTTIEDFDLIFSTNVRGLFSLTQVAIPELKKTRGNIINIGSVLGMRAMPVYSVYSASKAAVDYFTLSLAEEVKEYNIAVNCIAPTGAIYSEGNLQLFQDQAWIDTWEPREHFALGVVWLAKQDAKSFTGNLVYSRQLISQLGICKKWCCAAMGGSPSVGGPLRIDWESNLPVKLTEVMPTTGR